MPRPRRDFEREEVEAEEALLAFQRRGHEDLLDEARDLGVLPEVARMLGSSYDTVDELT